MEYNKQMTVGQLKKAIQDIPDNVIVNVTNDKGKRTSNIFVWFENLETRKFIELIGFKPFYEMTAEEKALCEKSGDVS